MHGKQNQIEIIIGLTFRNKKIKIVSDKNLEQIYDSLGLENQTKIQEREIK